MLFNLSKTEVLGLLFQRLVDVQWIPPSWLMKVCSVNETLSLYRTATIKPDSQAAAASSSRKYFGTIRLHGRSLPSMYHLWNSFDFVMLLSYGCSNEHPANFHFATLNLIQLSETKSIIYYLHRGRFSRWSFRLSKPYPRF